jgi:hypothetical protein
VGPSPRGLPECGGIATVESHQQIPAFHKNPRAKQLETYKSSHSKIVEVGEDTWAEAASFGMGQMDDISAAGIHFYDINEQRLLFPFARIDGDSYRVMDFDEDLRVVFNEKSMGLFFKETESLVQIKLRFVRLFSLALMNKDIEDE